MENIKLNHEEIIELIFFGIKKNVRETKSIDSIEIRKIFNRYNDLRTIFKKKYVSGELDTFKEASCLMVAINRSRLFDDKRVNAMVAVDAAYKICEQPFCNVGENNDILKKMDEVDFNEFKKNDERAYNYATSMLIDSLVYEDLEPFNYYVNLELFYQSALTLEYSKKKNKKKILNLFK